MSVIWMNLRFSDTICSISTAPDIAFGEVKGGQVRFACLPAGPAAAGADR